MGGRSPSLPFFLASLLNSSLTRLSIAIVAGEFQISPMSPPCNSPEINTWRADLVNESQGVELKAPTSGDAGSVRQAENSRETRVGRPFGRARFAAEPSVEFQFGSSAEVMPCFMRQREGKRFRSYSFMAYQTA